MCVIERERERERGEREERRRGEKNLKKMREEKGKNHISQILSKTSYFLYFFKKTPI